MRLHNFSFYMSNQILLSNNLNDISKKLEITINFFVLLSFLWFFLFIKLSLIKESTTNQFLYLQNDNTDKKEYIFSLGNSDKYNNEHQMKNNKYFKLRELTNFFQGKFSKEDFLKRKQMKYIIDTLINTKYIGKWFTKEEEQKKLLIGDSIEGLTKIKFSPATEITTQESALTMLINNYEDKYINHWLHHTSFIFDKNLVLTSDKMNNKLYINGRWETKLEYGEFFSTKYTRKYPCGSNLSIEFPLKNITILTKLSNGESFIETIDIIDNSNFNISFISSCGFNMTMEIYPEDQKIVNDTKKEVDKYVIIIFIIMTLHMLSVYLMNDNLKKNNEALNCISLFSLLQNINWHAYCFLTHITWSIQNNKFFYHFSIIALLYIFNIMAFDFNFTFNYWKIKKDHVSNRKIINLKICFYFSCYICFFVSFFMIGEVMIYYPLIYISSTLIWTPQILHNIVYYNKYMYPIFYMIISSIERTFFAFYFRAYDNNFYKIKGDKSFFYILIIYFSVTFIIIFLQMFKGPRFFLPKKYQKESFDFYKTKQELLDFSKDISGAECVICLLPIFYEETDQSSNNINNKNKEKDIEINNIDNSVADSNTSRYEIKNNTENKNVNVEINVLKINKIKKNNKRKEKNKSKKCFCLKEIFEILFIKGFYKFYRIPKNPQNKEYMKTPCNHVFHTICLEKWISRKKECPNCRNDLTDKLF